MRKLMILSWIIILVFSFSKAQAITFSPIPNDLYELDHSYAYSWQINWSVPVGQTITGASLVFEDIYNWANESNTLFLRLMDNTPSNGTNMNHGILRYYDNQADGDYFGSTNPSTPLTSQNFSTTPHDWTYTFTNTQLTTLVSYASDGKFYLGFDPDCHYYNNGITFTIVTERQSVPEPSTFLLLGSGLLLGVGFMRKQAWKKG